MASSFKPVLPADITGQETDSIHTHPPAGSNAMGASPTGTLFHQRSREKPTEPNSQLPSA